MKLESNHHLVFLLHYHLVLVVKYRRKVFDNTISARAREIFEHIGRSYGITVEEWNHDHTVRVRNPNTRTACAKTLRRTDYSSHDLYVSSDAEKPDYPRFYRRAEQCLAREQRKLSHMQEQSNNWYRQKTKIARLHERVRNTRRDFLHKTANKLVEQYDCVCVEDLNLQAVSQSLKLGKSTLDNGFGLLRDMLAYKLEKHGGCMVKIDRFYPSSQLCRDCGYKNTDTKNLSVREWDCPQCGVHHDRDVNAALNIRDEGKRLIS